ncbi:type II secretion system protein [Chrysiogenes arsenatis]|uniref:type II secretion system protein n=1 Tax=Chrysiogenes arsenatis TaxID=309797 RepID=UPI000420EB7E|nr:type II secretion system protein [Chrysiogenes arsenatis]
MRSRKAFTMLELVVVIVILGILAGSATMLWPGRDLEVGAYSERLVSDIRYVQLRTMTCETCSEGAFVISGNSYAFTLDGVAESFADGDTTRNLGSKGFVLSGSNIIFDNEFGVPNIVTHATMILSGTTICIYAQTGHAEVGACE